MKTIETQAMVSDDGILTAKVPPDIKPGEHHTVILIDESSKMESKDELKLGRYNVGLIPENVTFRREDMYDYRV